jgi:hypothetical protein
MASDYTLLTPITLTFETRDGKTTAEIRIAVDIKALAYALGPKAIRNKKRRSRAVHGAIVVEAFPVRHKAVE